MCIFVEQILNKPIDSNSFVIYSQANNSCIVIDPGTEDNFDLLVFLKEKNLNPEYVFLTHEHFDHIWGVNKLRKLYPCKIVCSIKCSEKIVEKKKNMSLFYDQVGFETDPADILTEDIDCQMIWNSEIIEFIQAKGHTDAGICILIDNHLFTGDTIIRNTKTVTKLPGGSKTKLIETLSDLNFRFSDKNIMVHSGHGNSFWYSELINQAYI